jgi:hypothetical protein
MTIIETNISSEFFNLNYYMFVYFTKYIMEPLGGIPHLDIN